MVIKQRLETNVHKKPECYTPGEGFPPRPRLVSFREWRKAETVYDLAQLGTLKDPTQIKCFKQRK